MPRRIVSSHAHLGSVSVIKAFDPSGQNRGHLHGYPAICPSVCPSLCPRPLDTTTYTCMHAQVQTDRPEKTDLRAVAQPIRRHRSCFWDFFDGRRAPIPPLTVRSAVCLCYSHFEPAMSDPSLTFNTCGSQEHTHTHNTHKVLRLHVNRPRNFARHRSPS